MKTIVIDRNSWHYKWMVATDVRPSNPDICAYTRALIKTALITLLWMGLLAVTTASFGDFFAWIAACSMSGTLVVMDTTSALALALIFLFLVATCWAAAARIANSVPKVPEDVKAMWNSITGKACCRIEYK